MMRVVITVLALFLLTCRAVSASDELNQQLYEAVNAYDSVGVASLIEKGADPNSPYITGLTALMRAVEISQVEIVRQLLASGADPNLQDNNGRSTAEIAIETDNPEVIEALLAGGADFNVPGVYGDPLVLQVVQSGRENSRAIVSVMGKHNVDMNLGTSSQTPLYYAVEQGDAEMAALLLEAGADPSVATESGGLPLNSALDYPEILALLLEAGADPNGVDRYGDPILFQALFSVSLEAAEELINAGADVNRPGSDGRTPLVRARDGGAEEIVAFLESHGASDGSQETTREESSSQPSSGDAVPDHDAYPRMADLPVYPGAQTMFILDEETHSANFLSTDPLSEVAATTEALLADAGWEDGNHPHAIREDEHYYVMFVKDEFLMIVDVSIARAMNNQTAITYAIIPRNSSFGKMIE